MEKIKLGQIAKVRKGKKITESKDINSNSKRYLLTEDLYTDDKIKYSNDDGIETTEDDIILSWDGSIGEIRYGISGLIGSTLARIRLSDEALNIFHPYFVGLFLESKRNHLIETSTGATIKHINRKALLDIEIPCWIL